MSKLPLYDAELNVDTFNIFQPLEKIMPYDLPKLAAATTLAPAAVTPVALKQQQQQQSTTDLYCKACKKKFSNLATYNNHLNSAKHIANEKKQKPVTTKQQQQQQPTKIAVHPQVQEALNNLEQAKNFPDSNMAITICWNESQKLYSLKRPQYTEQALRLLLDKLNTSTFTSAQITSFRYQSQLALARLLCIYQELDQARTAYLNALETKWKLTTHELLTIAKDLKQTSIRGLFDACDTLATKYLTRERNRTAPAPAIKDANNAITLILNEAGNLFAQKQTYQEIPCEHISIVLYSTCSLVCVYEKYCSPQDCYEVSSQVFESLKMTHKVVEMMLLEQNDWNLFRAMLLSLEMDDIVRAQRIQKSFKQTTLDIQLLLGILNKKMTQNDSELKQEFNYLQLLVKHEAIEPLLLQKQTKQEQMDILCRLERLV